MSNKNLKQFFPELHREHGQRKENGGQAQQKEEDREQNIKGSVEND